MHDPEFADAVVNNAMIQLLKSGVVQKKSESQSMFGGGWEERFMCLTNCGLLYFAKGQDQPKKFKPLNNFIFKPLTDEEEKSLGRSNVLKLIFNKKLVKQDMLIQYESKATRKAWMKAFYEFQLATLEARMSQFAKRLSEV